MTPLQQKALLRIILFTPQYEPYYPGLPLFHTIRSILRLPDVSNCKVAIERGEFEKHLASNTELGEVYVEFYSAVSEFHSYTFIFEGNKFEFNCMSNNGKMLLVFYAKNFSKKILPSVTLFDA